MDAVQVAESRPRNISGIMISERYGFIYVHIPKTGGNSIQTALAPYADDVVVLRPSVGHVLDEDGRQGVDVFNPALGFDRPEHKHATLSDYRERLGDDFSRYLIVTSVRNPWDRVISNTAFHREDGLPMDRVVPLDDLVLPRSMVDYLTLEGDVRVDHAIRFEEMQSDFDALCDRLGLSRTPLPHKNRSRRGGYATCFDVDTARHVSRAFAADNAYFGYTF